MTEAQKETQKFVLDQAAAFGLEQMNRPMGQAQQQPWAGVQVPDRRLQEQQRQQQLLAQQQQAYLQQQVQMAAWHSGERDGLLQQLQQRLQHMLPQQPQVQPTVQMPMVQPTVAPWHQPPAPTATQDLHGKPAPRTPPVLLREPIGQQQDKTKDMDGGRDKEKTREKVLAKDKEKEKEKEKKKKKKAHHHSSESDDEPRRHDGLVEQVLAALETRGPQRPLPPKPEETKPDEQPQKKKWSWDPTPHEQPQKKKGAWQAQWCWECNKRTWWGKSYGCQNTECSSRSKEKGQSWQGKKAAAWAKENAAGLDQAPKTPEVVDLDPKPPKTPEAPTAAAALAEEASAAPAVDAAVDAEAAASTPAASSSAGPVADRPAVLILPPKEWN